MHPDVGCGVFLVTTPWWARRGPGWWQPPSQTVPAPNGVALTGGSRSHSSGNCAWEMVRLMQSILRRSSDLRRCSHYFSQRGNVYKQSRLRFCGQRVVAHFQNGSNFATFGAPHWRLGVTHERHLISQTKSQSTTTQSDAASKGNQFIFQFGVLHVHCNLRRRGAEA